MKFYLNFLFAILICLLSTACNTKSEKTTEESISTDINLNKDSSIVLKYSDTMQDGTPTYNVILPNGSVNHATPEEIALFLSTGKWEFEK